MFNGAKNTVQNYSPDLWSLRGAIMLDTTENVTVYTTGFRPQLQKLYLILRAIGFQV
jgi:hypothetical protein